MENEKFNYSLTHHIELERGTAAFALGVEADAGVVAGRGSRDALQNERVLANDDTLRYVAC